MASIRFPLLDNSWIWCWPTNGVYEADSSYWRDKSVYDLWLITVHLSSWDIPDVHPLLLLSMYILRIDLYRRFLTNATSTTGNCWPRSQGAKAQPSVPIAGPQWPDSSRNSTNISIYVMFYLMISYDFCLMSKHWCFMMFYVFSKELTTTKFNLFNHRAHLSFSWDESPTETHMC